MSKREYMREKRRRQEQRKRFWVIFSVGLVAIVIAAVIIFSNQPKSPSVGTINTAVPFTRPQTSSLSMGDPNAPVKVEEFADFQCPTCKLFATDYEPQIVSQYIATGKVYFSFRPMSFIDNYAKPAGSESKNAAAAAYCANDQGKFWEYHDILFANWTGENVGSYSIERLKAFAQAIGLDTTQFNSCITSKKYANQVTQDAVYSNSMGVSQTPSFIVNGKLVTGKDILTALEEAVAAAGK
jgi:protein-disulfide isomerase